MSSAVDIAGANESDDPSRDPFGTARIELDDAELRAASPAAWLAGVRERLDALTTRLTNGENP